MASKSPADTAKIRKNSRPYLISMGYENGIHFIHTMSPLMSKLLSKAEFAEADITFNETYEYHYLFNLAVFDDITMEWAVVSRVRMDKEGTKAYALALKKTFQKCEEDHPEFNPGDSLMGIVTDWSDAEISGLGEAIGKEAATKVLRRCMVHWARSWQRVRDRVACSHDKPHEKALFSKIASHISDIKGSHGQDVIMCFKVLCGDSPAELLVEIVKGFKNEDATFIDTHCNWSAARNWASWWLRPSHLQMLHVDFSPMVDSVWEKCPNNTIAVERKNRDAKDNVPVPIRQGLINIYKLDKSYCAKHIAAENRCSISYSSRSSDSRATAAEVRRKQRRMQGMPDKQAVQGPPDKSCHFKSTPKR